MLKLRKSDAITLSMIYRSLLYGVFYYSKWMNRWWGVAREHRSYDDLRELQRDFSKTYENIKSREKQLLAFPAREEGVYYRYLPRS